jgi:hypothetical protein
MVAFSARRVALMYSSAVNAELACESLFSAFLKSTGMFVLALLSLATLMAFSLSDILLFAMERLPLEAQPAISSMTRAPMKNIEKTNFPFEVLFGIGLLLLTTDYSSQLKS